MIFKILLFSFLCAFISTIVNCIILNWRDSRSNKEGSDV